MEQKEAKALANIETLDDALVVIKALLEENMELRKRVAKLEEEVAVLKKDSSTSSKPPSLTHFTQQSL